MVQDLVQGLLNATLACCWYLVMLEVLGVLSYNLFRMEHLP